MSAGRRRELGGRREPHWHRRLRSASKDAKPTAVLKQAAGPNPACPLSAYAQEITDPKPCSFDDAKELAHIRFPAGVEMSA